MSSRSEVHEGNRRSMAIFANLATERDEPSKPTELKPQERQILDLLGELGGSTKQSDFVKQEGDEVILPVGMTPAAGIKHLQQYVDAEHMAFRRTFNFRPWDGAVATTRVLQNVFGTVGLPQKIEGMFGVEYPPELISVPVSPTETVQCMWGRSAFPIFGDDAYIETGYRRSASLGRLFELTVSAPRSISTQVEGLFTLVNRELETNSIYRGKAFDGQEEPEFIDLSKIDPDKVIYSEEVLDAFAGNVWAMIEHADLMRELNVPLKRSVLLEGPYGTGKSIGAYLTALKAVNAKKPWTFIYCRPNRDDLPDVLRTAQLYQPCVVFFEDVDVIASTSDDDELTELLDIFDGVTNKGTEILMMMTTNHIDRIHQAMARPGRLDAVISIHGLDNAGIKKLIDITVDPSLLASDIDYDAIVDAMEGYSPAFIKEAIDRTTRYAIARANGRPKQLVTEDFVKAAHGLRPQFRLMERAGHGEHKDEISTQFLDLIRKAVNGSSLVFPGEKEAQYVLAVANDGSAN